MAAGSTMYERVGGEEFFDALTQRFYDAVAQDPVLKAVYPQEPDEFEAARVHLKLFLVQYWGGPPVYRDARGEPRLRMRHAHISVGPEERDAWVRHMAEAVKAAELSPLDETQMLGYFTVSAAHMVNTE